MSDWPVVIENDDGIRPAGEPDECFYCHQKIGEEHKRDCVIVTKRVRVRYTIEVEIDVPHEWDPSMVLFSRNESRWCANNVTVDIEADIGRRAANGCLCDGFKCEFVDVADETPQRRARAAGGEG